MGRQKRPGWQDMPPQVGPTIEESVAAAARLLQPRKRASRPGQVAPTRLPRAARGLMGAAACDDGAAQHDGASPAPSAGPATGASTSSGSGITHSERKCREHAAHAQRREAAIQDTRRHAVEQAAAMLQMCHAMLLQCMDVSISCALARHPCCHIQQGVVVAVPCDTPLGEMRWDEQAGTFAFVARPPAAAAAGGEPSSSGSSCGGVSPPAGIDVLSCRPVVVMRFTDTVLVQVPTVRCAHCQRVWEVQPEEVGCTPATPVQATKWYAIDDAETYSQLARSDGTGCGAFSDALARATRVTAGMDPCTELPQADDDARRAAVYNYRRVIRPALDEGELGASEVIKDLGPAADCPACAAVPTPEEIIDNNDGEWPGHLIHMYDVRNAGELPPLRCSMFDGCNKLNKLASAGAASVGLEPSFSTYLGTAHAEVARLAPQRAQRQAHMSALEAVEPGADCHPNIYCAREQAVSGDGVLELHGVVGGVCHHVIPLRNAFVGMTSAENFTMYDVVLDQLQQEVRLVDVYIDHACVYKRHLDVRRRNDPNLRVPDELHVGWMHARGHGPECALANSGLYQLGAGRRVGEQPEILWADCKPVGGLVRFMAPHNWHDFVDDTLAGVAARKNERFPELLLHQHETALAKQAECIARMRNLEEAAACQGHTTAQLQATAEAALMPQAPSDAANGPQEKKWAEYARTWLQQRKLRALRSGRGDLYVLPGSDAMLHAHIHDDAYLAKLDHKAARLLMLLGESVAPTEDSASLRRALALLRLAEVTRLQAALERAVGEYAVLRGARRAAGAAGKDSKSLQRKRKARSKKVRSILAELGVWRQVPDLPKVDGDQVVMCLPQAGLADNAMQRLYEGVFPWREGEGGVALAVLAEKYRDAKAELDRTEEEIILLRWERGQTARYMSHMREKLAGVAAAKRAAAEACCASVTRVSADAVAARDAFGMAMQRRAEATLLQRAVDKYARMQGVCAQKFAALP